MPDQPPIVSVESESEIALTGAPTESALNPGGFGPAPSAAQGAPRRARAQDLDQRAAFHRRVQLFETISQNPGVHLRELSRRTGLAEGVLRHHLDHLLGKGAVKARRDRNRVRFYACESRGLPDDLVPDLRQCLAAEIERSPGLTHQDLCRRLGLPRTTVDYHIKLLEAEGSIRVEMEERRRRYSSAVRPQAPGSAIAGHLPSAAHAIAAPSVELVPTVAIVAAAAMDALRTTGAGRPRVIEAGAIGATQG